LEERKKSGVRRKMENGREGGKTHALSREKLLVKRDLVHCPVPMKKKKAGSTTGGEGKVANLPLTK